LEFGKLKFKWEQPSILVIEAIQIINCMVSLLFIEAGPVESVEEMELRCTQSSHEIGAS